MKQRFATSGSLTPALSKEQGIKREHLTLFHVNIHGHMKGS